MYVSSKSIVQTMWIESSLQSHRILFRGGVAFVLSKATKILGKFCEHKHKRLVFNIAVGLKCVQQLIQNIGMTLKQQY